MELGSYFKQVFTKLSEVRKGGLHLLLLIFFFTSIFLVFFLDLLNIEAFASFNQKFMFDFTWKGRMFYLFFAWLLVLESVLDWENITKKHHAVHNRLRVIFACVFAAIPILYILSVNFLGLNQVILDLGHTLQINPDFINEHWPLSLEYLIFASFFILAAWLAEGLAGLKRESISLSLLSGISAIYMLDTIWPFGTFKPLQLLAVPTAAFATALLDLLGYNVDLRYPFSSPERGSLPVMTVGKGGLSVSRGIGWQCAGVHSLLLFVLITLVFFKKTTIQRERKTVFFLLGAAGTYLTNIFRIASFFIIAIHFGEETGNLFHDSYGELYFIAWMLLFFIIIITVESGKISRLIQVFRRKKGESHSGSVVEDFRANS